MVKSAKTTKKKPAKKTTKKKAAPAKKKTGKKKAAPHNVVSGTAAELGIVGTFALFALLLTVLWAIRNRRPDADRPTHLILAALFATIFVHALAYDNFFADPAMWVIAALLATGAGIFPLLTDDPERPMLRGDLA